MINGRTAQILSLRVGHKLEAGHQASSRFAASLRAGIDFLYNLKHTINTPRLTLALA